MQGHSICGCCDMSTPYVCRHRILTRYCIDDTRKYTCIIMACRCVSYSIAISDLYNVLLQAHAKTVIFVWLAGEMISKDEWSCVGEVHGVVFVQLPLQIQKQKLYANNYTTLATVG